MTPQTSKIGAYIEQRLHGIDPQQAARLAGYSEANVKATASRLEARDDVRSALRRAKREGVTLGRVVIAASKKRSGVKKRGGLNVVLDDDPDSSGDSNRPEPWALKDSYDSPLSLLLDVMNNKKAPGGVRIQCAKDAMPYCHARKEGTKGDEKAKNAKEAGNGYQPQARPSHLRRAA